MRTVAWLILLAMLGVAAWWVLRPEDDASSESRESIARTARDESAPELVGTGRASEQAPIPNGRDEAEEHGAASDAEPTVRHLLVGELVGLDPELKGTAHIVVTGLASDYESPPARPEGMAGSDGRFSIDVTPIFVPGKTILDLQVQVDHPAYMPVTTKVPVTEAAADGDTRRHEARIELTRAGVVTGRVETSRGAPVETAVGAFLLEDGKPVRGAAGLADSDASGQYRLRVARKGRYLVVAASVGSSAPAVGEVEAAPGWTVEAPLLALDEGVAIHGRLFFRGAPLEGATLTAAPSKTEGVRLRVRTAIMLWRDGRVETGEARSTTDVLGRFELTGLAPGPYRVEVDDAKGFTVHMDAGHANEQVVEAPASDVKIVLEGCLVTLAVQRDGKPLAEPSILVSGRAGAVNVTAGPSGELRVLLPSGDEVFVVLSAPDAPSTTVTVHVPADQPDHREVVDVGAQVVENALVVVLAVPKDAAIQHLGLALYASEKTSWPFYTHDVDVRDGTFRVEGVRAGSFVLRVRPGGPWWGGHGFWMEESTDVEVPAEGEVKVRISVHAAGRLRIAARNEAGESIPAACEIRDADGVEQQVGYVTRTAGGMTISYGALGEGGFSSVDPALPAGTYEIRLAQDGYFAKTPTVEVVAGESRDVEVTLERTR